MTDKPTTADTQDNSWIEPYYKLSKDELLNKVDKATLNQIRNTLGDQKFIDQWALSEADYNFVVGNGNEATTTTTTEVKPTTQTVITENAPVTTYGEVRRVYTTGYPAGSTYYGGDYVSGSRYATGYPYGTYGRSYYTGSGYYNSGYPTQYTTGYSSYPYSGVTRSYIRNADGTTVLADGGLRRSVVRTEVPAITILGAPTTTNTIDDGELRRSIVRTEVPATTILGAPTTTYAEPIRTSYVRAEAPITRVVSGSNVVGSSYYGAPVTRVISGDNTLRTS